MDGGNGGFDADTSVQNDVFACRTPLASLGVVRCKDWIVKKTNGISRSTVRTVLVLASCGDHE